MKFLIQARNKIFFKLLPKGGHTWEASGTEFESSKVAFLTCLQYGLRNVDIVMMTEETVMRYCDLNEAEHFVVFYTGPMPQTDFYLPADDSSVLAVSLNDAMLMNYDKAVAQKNYRNKEGSRIWRISPVCNTSRKTYKSIFD